MNRSSHAVTTPRSGPGIRSSSSISSSARPASERTSSGSSSPASDLRNVRTAFRACLGSGVTTFVSENWIIASTPDPVIVVSLDHGRDSALRCDVRAPGARVGGTGSV